MRKLSSLLRLLVLVASVYVMWSIVSKWGSARTKVGTGSDRVDIHGDAVLPLSSPMTRSTAGRPTAATSPSSNTGSKSGSSRPALGVTTASPAGRMSAYNASVGIPRILHQTFSSEMLYENYKPLINSCLALNPDWTYYLWRDRDADALIAAKYPEFLGQYRRYKDVLERSDSIRYIVLHHFGGIYLDMDVECKRPFYPALSGVDSFLDQERIEQTNIFWGWPFSVMNSAMGGAPGHPFYRLMIDEMAAVKGVGYAFSTTGPEILTRVYNKYLKLTPPPVPIRLLEPKVMSPLMDNNKNWRTMCSGHLNDKKPEAQRSWKERGCLMLQAKNWRLDDTEWNSTVCVHRFLHLGYSFAAGARKKLFNATKEFWPRLHLYT